MKPTTLLDITENTQTSKIKVREYEMVSAPA
jgi:hypothetical protein